MVQAARSLPDMHLIEQKRVLQRQAVEAFETPGSAAVAALQVDVHDQHMVIRFQVAQSGHPFDRFEILHLGIVQAGGHEHGRIGLGADVRLVRL